MAQASADLNNALLATLRTADPEKLDPPGYFSSTHKEGYDQAKIRVMEMRNLALRSAEIVYINEVPLSLVQGLKSVVEHYTDAYNTLAGVRDEHTSQQAFDRIASLHNNFFEISTSNRIQSVITAIDNYAKVLDSKMLDEIEKLQIELENKNKRADEILKKLENPSAEKLLSDYAREYETEETRHRETAASWLYIGISFTLIFMTVVFLAAKYEWLPITITLTNITAGVTSFNEIINIPAAITKAVLISVFIYVIVFCFRQYSINSHLRILNQNKKNAFNSFRLFDAAIGEQDSEARKVLLMSLARSIHDSIQTGYLPSKENDHPFTQNIDLSKLASSK